ncbi:class I SAM-dependent methyltransferase [Christensenellaceae bacterium OttesenSCG-928-K19]|nr:class I SAM-dependent methyltransferase [Christensenellaceae bacterium OttesenSCG-928-K19]
MAIKESFDAVAAEYDAQRRKLLPCFEDLYTVPFLVTDCKKPNPRVLDLGGGTGLFSYYLLQRYPQAQVTLVDLSGDMLAVAKERFKKHEGFGYIVADYARHRFEEKYDMVISALSIHHLAAEDKERLYHTCYGILQEGGIFINADQVLSPSPGLERMYHDRWRSFVDKSGLSPSEIEAAYARTVHDDPSPLADQLTWLGEAGFKAVDCVYKYLHFCVMVGLK